VGISAHFEKNIVLDVIVQDCLLLLYCSSVRYYFSGCWHICLFLPTTTLCPENYYWRIGELLESSLFQSYWENLDVSIIVDKPVIKGAVPITLYTKTPIYGPQPNSAVSLKVFMYGRPVPLVTCKAQK